MTPDEVMSIKKKFVRNNKGYVAPNIVVNEIPIMKIASATPGMTKIKGRMSKLAIQKSNRKPYLVIYERHITDDTGSIRAIWFNKPALEYSRTDKEYVFLGKVNRDSFGKQTIVSPIFSTPSDVEKWQIELNKLLISS